MKKAITFVFLLTIFSFAFSTNISVEEAQRVSRNFLAERYVSQNINIQLEDLTLQYTELDENGQPIFYRFGVRNFGFILISATDQATPVLAYSMEGEYRSNPASELFLENYKKQIVDVKQRRAEASEEISSLWNRYLQEDFTPVRSRNAYVDPLITTCTNGIVSPLSSLTVPVIRLCLFCCASLTSSRVSRPLSISVFS